MGSARPVALLIAGLFLAALYGGCAFAEIRVQGPEDDVRVEAYGATVAELLAALGEHYAVRYRGAPASSGVTTTFEGPLRRVLVRVLKGNSYVIKGGGDGLEVIVVSLESPAATPPAVAISPAVTTSAATATTSAVPATLAPQPQLRVRGPVDDVRVEAYGATVVEILAALGEHYAVRYRGAPGSGGVTASFKGPLRRVLVRVLEGNNYVIKGGGAGLEVFVVSPQSPAISTVIAHRRAD
jgi:hypothetical protein